jgi:hypothetical protein
MLVLYRVARLVGRGEQEDAGHREMVHAFLKRIAQRV